MEEIKLFIKHQTPKWFYMTQLIQPIENALSY